MEVRIKKESGIEDLVKGFEKKELEQEKKIIEGGNVAELLQSYSSILYPFPPVRLPPSIKPYTPNEINTFLQATLSFEHLSHYPSFTGQYLTTLIQQNFYLGINNFTIDARNLPSLNQFSNLNGKEDDPLTLEYKGNLNFSNLRNCKNLAFTVYGNITEIDSRETRQNANLTIYGSLLFFITSAVTSNFYIHSSEGGIDYSLLSGKTKNCTFKSPDQKVIDELVNTLHYGDSNKIYLINPDKTETLVWNK